MLILNLAMAGSDYTRTVRYLSSPSGRMQCINITIIDDSVAMEGNKSFVVVLNTSDPNVILGNTQQVVTIIDSDGKYVER